MKPHLFLFVIFSPLFLAAQVKTTSGPVLENPAQKKMSCLVRGDDSTFYACRTIPGSGSIFIEKYDCNLLIPRFSTEIKDINGANDPQISMLYAAGNVYVLKSHYDDLKGTTELYYHSVSAKGAINEMHKSLFAVKNVYVEYEVKYNAQNNRLFVRASYEPYDANDYVSELYFFEPKNGLSKTWDKTVKRSRPGKGRQASAEESLVALEEGNAAIAPGVEKDHYFYFLFSTADRTDGLFYTYQLYILPAQSNSEKVLQFEFDGNYLIKSVKFSRTRNRELVIAGVLKNMEGSRANVGFFCYLLNAENNAFVSKTVKFANDELLLKIDPNIDNAPRYEYAFDYLVTAGKSIYLLAQQYNVEYVEAPMIADERKREPGSPLFSRLHAAAPSPATTNTIKYHYRDILVVKMDDKGKFESINTIPYRHSFNARIVRHYKQYYATSLQEQLYILRNDHVQNASLSLKENIDPAAIADAGDTLHTAILCTAFSGSGGRNQLLFTSGAYEQRQLCEGAADNAFFTTSGNRELILFTKNKGADQFIKVALQ